MAEREVTAMYLVGDTVLAQTSFKASFLPDSHAYFCSTCGEVWGRCFISFKDGGQSPMWTVSHVPCARHKPNFVFEQGKTPGSFIPDSYQIYTSQELSVLKWGYAFDLLPPAIIQRELQLGFAEYDRKLSNG